MSVRRFIHGDEPPATWRERLPQYDAEPLSDKELDVIMENAEHGCEIGDSLTMRLLETIVHGPAQPYCGTCCADLMPGEQHVCPGGALSVSRPDGVTIVRNR